MAVYEGARPRGGIALPWLRPTRGPRPDSVPASPRRPLAGARSTGARRAAARRGVRVARRPRAVGALLAAIVIIFSVAFLSLSQSVRVAATSYDIVRLVSERDRLSALKVDLSSNVERLGSEPAIRKEALDAGLGQLGAAAVLPAR
jgi:cell division protein FtsB